MSPPSGQPQLGLPGLDEPQAPRHRLFFALLPDETVRDQLADLAARLRSAHALQARWIDPSRYHVTLAFLGDHAVLRPATVEAAATAASRLAGTPFTWMPDLIDSFRGRQPPCVLREAQASPPMQALWATLRRELALLRLDQQVGQRFQPHVTLAYSRHALLAPAPVDPVAWPVERVVLLHSRIGASAYEELGSWPLRG